MTQPSLCPLAILNARPCHRRVKPSQRKLEKSDDVDRFFDVAGRAGGTGAGSSDLALADFCKLAII